VIAGDCRETINNRHHGGEREGLASKGAKQLVSTEAHAEVHSREVDVVMFVARRT
jgi:hypothetical protein